MQRALTTDSLEGAWHWLGAAEPDGVPYEANRMSEMISPRGHETTVDPPCGPMLWMNPGVKFGVHMARALSVLTVPGHGSPNTLDIP